jgi:hypothetical protein
MINNKGLIALTIAAIWVTGCTGTQIKISPESSAVDQSFNSPYALVGVKEVPAEKKLAVTGNLTEAFSNEIRSTGFAKEVYYPLRPNDKTDVTLDSQFNAEVDRHSGATFAKGFFTGFTLFIFEPLIWYDFDYTLAGNVDVIKDGKIIKRVNAKTDATVSVKWLSLSDLAKLQDEALIKAKKSLFQQLIHDMGK